MHALRLWDHGYLDFESDPNLAYDTYGDTVNDVVPIVTGSSVSGLFENDDDWNLGHVLLSRTADVRSIIHSNFTAIYT